MGVFIDLLISLRLTDCIVLCFFIILVTVEMFSTSLLHSLTSNRKTSFLELNQS